MRKALDVTAIAFPGILFLVTLSQAILVLMRITGAILWPWLVTFLPIIITTTLFLIAIVCSVAMTDRADRYIVKHLADDGDDFPI